MKVWTDINTFHANKICLTIGSFDGVHLGHLDVINQLKKIAKDEQGESVIFTLDPHPAKILNPQTKTTLLTTIDEKISLLEKAGIDHLILYPFTKEFSKTPYESFVKQVLVDKLHIHSLLIGHDNTIGKNKEGNFQQITKLAKQYNFEVQNQRELKLGKESISSTRIRSLLKNGELLAASKLLGYPYLVSGKVIKGKQLGNKLGFPTANIKPNPEKFAPSIGVYVVRVEHEQQFYFGMMNIGIRPTVEDNNPDPLIEVNIFDFNENIYGKSINISILEKLRDEHKFNDVEALRSQIEKDKAKAIAIIENKY